MAIFGAERLRNKTFVLETLRDNPTEVIRDKTDRTSSWRAEISSTLEMDLYSKMSSVYVIRVELHDQESNQTSPSP